MDKVERYLFEAKRLRTHADATVLEPLKKELQKIADEWEQLARERKAFLEEKASRASPI